MGGPLERESLGENLARGGMFGDETLPFEEGERGEPDLRVAIVNATAHECAPSMTVMTVALAAGCTSA